LESGLDSADITTRRLSSSEAVGRIAVRQQTCSLALHADTVKIRNFPQHKKWRIVRRKFTQFHWRRGRGPKSYEDRDQGLGFSQTEVAPGVINFAVGNPGASLIPRQDLDAAFAPINKVP